ncbi:MAG: aldolase [Sphingomonas sp.]|nr:aldolase [Sphingomonas sp.]
MTAPPSETLHASCVAIGGRALLIAGPSGSGKSDLALRLIDRGATLVSDDYTHLTRSGERLIASAPDRIAGRIEVRGIGIVALPWIRNVPVALLLRIEDRPERMPLSYDIQAIAGVDVPVFAIAALEASAAVKAELALRQVETLR